MRSRRSPSRPHGCATFCPSGPRAVVPGYRPLIGPSFSDGKGPCQESPRAVDSPARPHARTWFSPEKDALHSRENRHSLIDHAPVRRAAARSKRPQGPKARGRVERTCQWLDARPPRGPALCLTPGLIRPAATEQRKAVSISRSRPFFGTDPGRFRRRTPAFRPGSARQGPVAGIVVRTHADCDGMRGRPGRSVMPQTESSESPAWPLPCRPEPGYNAGVWRVKQLAGLGKVVKSGRQVSSDG
jgi:hypothetical protein